MGHAALVYVNTTSEPKGVSIDGAMKGLLSGRQWTGTLRLEPLGVELLERNAGLTRN